MKKSLTLLLSTLCASVALAEAPAPANELQQAASALVDKLLLKKSDAKRKRFSRSSPPKTRRVRVLDTVAVSDAGGKQFVRFAVDARYSGDDEENWAENNSEASADQSQDELSALAERWAEALAKMD